MNVYRIAVLSILAARWLIGLAAGLLNLRHIFPDIPEEFRGVYDPARYRKSQEYLGENTGFSLAADGTMTALTIAFILLGGFETADRFARGFRLAAIPTGFVFAGSLMLLSALCRLPWDIYRTFVIEQRFGFNRTTPRTFAADLAKKWLLAGAFGGAVFAAVVWLFMEAGPRAWLWCWAVTTLFQLLMIFIAPALIMPLFNRFTPMQEGELRNAITAYARAQRFRMRGVFTMDASKRSTKSNAFFTGLGRFRRIVLFDTLIARHSVDELVSVLAHEVGHYRRRHLLTSLLFAVLSTGLMLWALSLLVGNRGLFDAFGMKRASVYAGIFLFGFLYIPVQTVIGILFNALSRRHEYEADAYAAATYGKPEAMIAALKKLSADNLSNLTPHPLKVLLDYNHPPVLDRIAALRKLPPTGAS